MDIQATHKNARMTARKLRLVARMLPGMAVKQAELQLQYFPGKAAVLINQVLKSAVANAVHNHELQAQDLVVRNVIVNPGFVMKRFIPAPKGTAHPILKRTAHVTVVVGEAQSSAKKPAKKKAAEIETLTAEEYATWHGEHEHAVETEAQDVKTVPNTAPVSEAKADKQTGEVFQKVKMNQQGGDVHKTARRQSKKSGHK